MTDQTPENTPFFLTAPMPCPYLEGREERKLFTHLTGRRATLLHHMLNEHGFRRSQNLVYRPACEDCSACQAARVVAKAFSPSTSQRRTTKRNNDLIGTERPPIVNQEQYNLFQRYLTARHQGGGMNEMSYTDYELMVEDTPVNSMLIEYRFSQTDGELGPLIGVALSDVLPDGLSMVYSFFDPDYSDRSLGNFMILDHIRRVKDSSLPYLYLGYWVRDSAKMAYKANFQPLEVLTAGASWAPLSDDHEQ